jgi:hypothetical protein
VSPEHIEASELARIFEGRHAIRRLPDTTFAPFAKLYLEDQPNSTGGRQTGTANSSRR